MLEDLQPQLIKVNSSSETKDEILIEISELVGRICSLTSGEVYRGLKQREELSSTAIGNGIAIPHCSFDILDKFYLGVITHNSIDFDSIDGSDTKVIFFSVGPKREQKRHISTLTTISRIGLDEDLLSKISSAEDSDAIYSMLKRGSEDTISSVDKCQFTIHIQSEDILIKVLEELTTKEDRAISIIDSSTPGEYLNKLPLFSSFWNDIDERFSKLVVATIDKRLMNDTIRKLNLLSDDKLYITVNDLLYSSGSVDY